MVSLFLHEIVIVLMAIEMSLMIGRVNYDDAPLMVMMMVFLA